MDIEFVECVSRYTKRDVNLCAKLFWDSSKHIVKETMFFFFFADMDFQIPVYSIVSFRSEFVTKMM